MPHDIGRMVRRSTAAIPAHLTAGLRQHGDQDETDG
jgi:hypothetical protein